VEHSLQTFPPTYADFFLRLLFFLENGGDMFLRNIWLYPNYRELYPARLYCCEKLISKREVISVLMIAVVWEALFWAKERSADSIEYSTFIEMM
jgi:hypothetical protein